MTMQTDKVLRLLGGEKALRRKVKSIPDLRESIRSGIPARSLKVLLSLYPLKQEEIAEALHIPSRTLQRRMAESQNLIASESEKVVRLARILAQAEDVFDRDARKVTSWLRRPNRALGGEAPLSLLDSDLGAQQVSDILGRIEGGVFS